jgi:hypothetical protein
MADTKELAPLYSDVTLIKLARELAWEIYPLETILKAHNLTIELWDTIKELPRFQRYLESELVAWHSATNAHERVKVKSSIMVEEWLPELYSRMHDAQESLNGKIEAGKLLARLAGMGLDRANITGGEGEKFSITINLGGDAKLKFEKQVTPQVIEGEAFETGTSS